MQANELRIGNFVERRGEAGIVVSIDLEDIWLQFGGDWGDQEKWLCESVDPIPLTPEWLERLGFMFDFSTFEFADGMNNGNLYITSINGMWIAELGNGNKNISRQIHFVHQFQNLYFALTGEELTIKEPA